MSQATANPSRLLRRSEVQALTGLPVSTLYDAMSKGTFPAPLKLSYRSVAWRAEDVQAWIASRPAARHPVAVA